MSVPIIALCLCLCLHKCSSLSLFLSTNISLNDTFGELIVFKDLHVGHSAFLVTHVCVRDAPIVYFCKRLNEPCKHLLNV